MGLTWPWRTALWYAGAHGHLLPSTYYLVLLTLPPRRARGSGRRGGGRRRAHPRTPEADPAW
eukprot:scaffold10351_cov62-Phaeocystis_antarctica.AAC.1